MPGLNVAVIGAGASGLCAARHMGDTQGRVRPIVFEQSGRVGGTWVYSQDTGRDEHGLPRHSSMYKNLTTNLAKEVMAFPGFPFASQEKSFVHHTEVLEYLEQYTEAYSLRQYIQFNTQVLKVTPKEGRWEVTTLELNTREETTDTYNAVVVCNGHFSVPVMPHIPGMELYTGKVVHSHDYRTPEAFQGDTVLILGGGASGTDIAMELSSVTDQVYLSHNRPPLSTRLPGNVTQVSGVAECLGPSTFLLRDGSKVTATSTILATGYHYTFPFLTPECGVHVRDMVVGPLYKHLVSTEHPSLAFLGLNVEVCPFPQFDLKIRYFLKTLLGEVALPSKEEMNRDTQEEAKYRREVLGMPDKYFHKMGSLQWQYHSDLARLGNIQPLSQTIENLYEAVYKRRMSNLPDYKKDIYKLEGEDGGFIEILYNGNTEKS